MKTYGSPAITRIGKALETIQFGGIYKNPPTSDGQTCGDNNGLCPDHEMDE
jgi:hypothetical protein